MALSYIIASLVFEVKLMKIFRDEKETKRNKNQPDAMVPWKAIGANLVKRKIPQTL